MNVANSTKDAQQLEVDCEVCKSWAAVYQSIARRMLSCLDNSEVLKVGARELEEHMLAPDEPSVNIEHIAWQTKYEKRKIVPDLQQTRSKRDPGRQCGKM